MTAVLLETRALTAQAKARATAMSKGTLNIEQRGSGKWEQRAATMIPKRTYRGPGLAIGALAELSPEERREWHAFSNGRKGAYTLGTLAEYWADGRRTILDIINRVEMETGIRDAELIVRQFELLARLGLTDFYGA